LPQFRTKQVNFAGGDVLGLFRRPILSDKRIEFVHSLLPGLPVYLDAAASRAPAKSSSGRLRGSELAAAAFIF